MRIPHLIILGLMAVLVGLGWSSPASALDINLRGYTAGGTLPAAAPSPTGSPVDIRAQLQAAIDAVSAAGGGTITIPSDTDLWFVSKPVWADKPNVTITGQFATASPGSSGTTIGVIGSGSGQSENIPPIIAGLPRQVTDKEITQSHRIDLNGILDTSIPAATYYGLKTKGRNAANNADVYTHGYVSNSLLNIGGKAPIYMGGYTYWLCPYDRSDPPVPHPEWYHYTFDIAIKQNTAGTLQGTICGVGTANDITNRFTYWMLGTFPNDADPNTIKFKFKTGDPDAGTYTVQTLPLGTITDTNVHRLTVQLDMGGGTCAAWLDGTQTSTLALGSVMNGNVPDPNKQMWRYEHGTFQLGALHNGINGDVLTDGLVSSQQHVDWTYAGFHMGYELRYTWGTTLTRADAGQITDSWRFFSGWGTNLVGYLPLTDNPTGGALSTDGKLLLVQQDYSKTYGFWEAERNAAVDTDGQNGIRNITLNYLQLYGPLLVGDARNLSLQSITPWGQHVFTFDDLNSGVMNGNNLASVTDTDCAPFIYSPYHSVVNWANKEVHSTNLNFYPPSGTGVRLIGCHGSIRYLFLNATQGAYYLKSYAGARGGTLSLESLCLDNEGWYIPTKGAFYVEFSPLGYGVTRDNNRFVLRDVFTGTIPYTSPVVDIGNVGEGTVELANIACGTAGAPYMQQIVRCANPNCYGTLENYVNIQRVWENQSPYGWYYNPGDLIYNDVDGYTYTCAAKHHPGAIYEAMPGLPSQWLFEDNRPHADEQWKSYWTRQGTYPTAWASGTGYAVGNVVSADAPTVLYCTDSRAYRCIAAHTADATNQPGSGANWQTYWVCLKWVETTAYTAGTSYVSSDGAYYQCTQSHTASLANRPRPWDKLPVNTNWPFQWIKYTGTGTCNIVVQQSELMKALPPVAGLWNTNGHLLYVHDPKTGNTTEYRCTSGGAPGTWQGVNPLGTAQ